MYILGLSLFRKQIDINVYTESTLKTMKCMHVRVFPVYVLKLPVHLLEKSNTKFSIVHIAYKRSF